MKNSKSGRLDTGRERRRVRPRTSPQQRLDGAPPPAPLQLGRQQKRGHEVRHRQVDVSERLQHGERLFRVLGAFCEAPWSLPQGQVVSVLSLVTIPSTDMQSLRRGLWTGRRPNLPDAFLGCTHTVLTTSHS